MQAPAGRVYNLSIYSYKDRRNNATHEPGADGKPDGLVYKDVTDAVRKCFSAGMVIPNVGGEFKLLIGIESKKGFSADHPYWIETPK